jgi:hypothetical protein
VCVCVCAVVYGIAWLDGWLPLWMMVEWVGVVIGMLVLCTSKNYSLPVYNDVSVHERVTVSVSVSVSDRWY